MRQSYSQNGILYPRIIIRMREDYEKLTQRRAKWIFLYILCGSIGTAIGFGHFLVSFKLQLSPGVSPQCRLPGPPLHRELELHMFHEENKLRNSSTSFYCRGLPFVDAISCDRALRSVAHQKTGYLNEPPCKSSSPWLASPYKRMIYMLDDALRWQSMAFQSEYEAHPSNFLSYCKGGSNIHNPLCESTPGATSGANKATPWHVNALASTHRVLTDSVHRLKSRMVRIRTQAPTFTKLRVQTILGGSVSTWTDLYENLRPSSRGEDNLLTQLKSAGELNNLERGVFVAGDSTVSTTFKTGVSDDMTFDTQGHTTLHDELVHTVMVRALHLVRRKLLA